MPTNIKLDIYNALFKSYLQYGLICWGGAKSSKLKPLLILQKKCIRHIAGVNSRSHTGQLFKSFDLLKIEDLFTNQISSFMHSYYNARCPTSFNNFLTPFRGENRTKSFVLDPLIKRSLERFPSYFLPKVWNSLAIELKRESSLSLFKANLKHQLSLSRYWFTIKTSFCDSIIKK